MDVVICILIMGGFALVSYALAPLAWAPRGKRYSDRKTLSYALGGLLFLVGLWLSNVPPNGLTGIFVILGCGGLVLEHFRRREERTIASEESQRFAKVRMREDRVDPRDVTRREHEAMTPEALEAILALPSASEPHYN